MEPSNDPASLSTLLQELKTEHRDLDEAIARLDAAPIEDELLMRRLKKRKLQLKDRIAAIERQIEPDEYA
ncbi:MAG: YdcH family protein [Rhodocyclales bacterium]|nr:YdcH family protein [Rhodocyclales bacterium]